MRTAKPGPGERVPPDQKLRKLELTSHFPHFIFEEFA
jgi:hypothetical protein